MRSATSATTAPRLQTTAPRWSSSEPNSKTVATEACSYVPKLQRKSLEISTTAANTFPLNMAANTEVTGNKNASEDADTFTSSAAQGVEIEGELQTIGTLNEDERTLETDVNTETEKTDEASRQVWPNQGLL